MRIVASYLKSASRYTFYKLEHGGQISHREELNSEQELMDKIESSRTRMNRIRVIKDERTFIDYAQNPQREFVPYQRGRWENNKPVDAKPFKGTKL